ncbi:MAG: hypothetical protein K0Q59_4341, partial [Paenibacillus sp.]|nr:hypothetical protein [Paenibacillus sp.]
MQRLNKESTIYNFTLIKKVRHRPLLLLLYGILPLPAALFLSVTVSRWIWLAIMAGLVLLPLLYSLLTHLYLRLIGSDIGGSWSFAWRLPWLGLLPKLHFPLRNVILIHHQLFWIGLAAIGCLYPWLGIGEWGALAALHIWFLLPRYWIFYLL